MWKLGRVVSFLVLPTATTIPTISATREQCGGFLFAGWAYGLRDAALAGLQWHAAGGEVCVWMCSVWRFRSCANDDAGDGGGGERSRAGREVLDDV